VVLGAAGNLGALTARDSLASCTIRGNCSAQVKMNPVNEYLGPYTNKSLQEVHLARGWLRLVRGDDAEGPLHMVKPPEVDTIHMTALSHLTTRSYGELTSQRCPEQRQQNADTARKSPANWRRHQSLSWSRRGRRARPAVSTRTYRHAHNSSTAGHNCNATQVLVLSEDWQRAQKN